MKYLAIIPARKGSKILKNKNFKKFNNKPLVYWTINSALKSKCFDKIFLSTDSKLIQKLGLKMGIECPYLRSKNLSSDTAEVHNVIKSVVNYYKKIKYYPDAIVLLQPTSPLREVKDIKKSCKIFKKYNADSLVSVVKIPHSYNPVNLYTMKNRVLKPKQNIKKILSRQKSVKLFARNGASIYITKINKIKNYILGGKVLGYVMSSIKSIDINDINDFNLAETIQKKFKINFTSR